MHLCTIEPLCRARFCKILKAWRRNRDSCAFAPFNNKSASKAYQNSSVISLIIQRLPCRTLKSFYWGWPYQNIQDNNIVYFSFISVPFNQGGSKKASEASVWWHFVSILIFFCENSLNLSFMSLCGLPIIDVHRLKHQKHWRPSICCLLPICIEYFP